jgi:aminomethyltransferase
VTQTFSPLHELHVAAGATFTDFAGWQMPVRYTSDLDEHHAVRTHAGIFDISHMGEIEVIGPDAAAFCDYAMAAQLSTIHPGQAKYTLLLNDDGGVIDDLIVYRRATDRYLVVANAGNRHAVVDALRTRIAPYRSTLVDVSDEMSLIAVQGPAAQAIVANTAGLVIGDGETALPDLGYYRFTLATFTPSRAAESASNQGASEAVEALIARTGYTGEDGFELYIANAAAPQLWRALVVAGESHNLSLAGLAARDTLRLEAGMPLYGHELGLSILPHQARLERTVALSKPDDFVGRAAVERFQPDGMRVLVGLAAEGRRAARADYELFANETSEVPVGTITSGVLSPTLGHPIAMAMVDADYAEVGATLSADIRGTRLEYTVTELPFYRRPR